MNEMSEQELRDYNIKRVLDRAWNLAKKGNRERYESVARALFAASDAMVKTVQDQGFQVMVSAGGFTWQPKPQPQPEAVQA